MYPDSQTQCSGLRLLFCLFSLCLFLPKHFIPEIRLPLRRRGWDLVFFFFFLIRHCWCHFNTSRNNFCLPKLTTSPKLVSKNRGANQEAILAIQQQKARPVSPAGHWDELELLSQAGMQMCDTFHSCPWHSPVPLQRTCSTSPGHHPLVTMGLPYFKMPEEV